MGSSSYIYTEKLCKRYKNASHDAVHQLSMDINQHEIFGLLGPNGAGKTTTISMLCQQLQATSGKISINNLDHKQHGESIKRIIGVVPQEIALYPKLTAFENLRFFGNLYGVRGRELKESISQHLERFGLIDRKNDAIESYSGGMKRRIKLIAGILHQPKIIFLDEPTVGIDVQSKAVIIDYLKELNQQGATIVYTSHHMEEAEQFCTQIAIIDQGEIIEKGSPLELIAKYDNCNTLEDIFLSLTGRKLRD